MSSFYILFERNISKQNDFLLALAIVFQNLLVMPAYKAECVRLIWNYTELEQMKPFVIYSP
jgi:hypothetical protein